MKPIDITVTSDTDPPEKIRYIDSHRTSELVSDYINANKDTFPDDSFDFYFITSRTNLWSTTTNEKAHGISFTYDIYDERLIPSDNHKSGLIVHHGSPCEYVTAAHEIAHLMNIEHESQKKGYSDGIKQCYAIMQETNPFCPDCLKWTNQNIEDLQKFSNFAVFYAVQLILRKNYTESLTLQKVFHAKLCSVIVYGKNETLWDLGISLKDFPGSLSKVVVSAVSPGITESHHSVTAGAYVAAAAIVAPISVWPSSSSSLYTHLVQNQMAQICVCDDSTKKIGAPESAK
ncbi:hypothetical protein PV327_002932 [Microctonus hyperodae]|uniref:Uncharacterized protein n=1 Tax=Microctonus hyperodae TaxID=165561 RepID=A0AA39L0H7_MICHY|nr:hypothetical protein PV327_002932 [Microctonus hyperodae]